MDRGYLAAVDATLRRSGLVIDTLFLSPKMNLGAIVEQFKTEGVKAIVFLNKMLERSGRVAMQQFKPNGQVQGMFIFHGMFTIEKKLMEF